MSDEEPAPLVSLRDAGVSLGGHRVLSGLSLDLHRGEIVTVIGPNGAGKSTLARLVLGLLSADEGSVHRAPGLTMGYLPQRFTVDPVLPLTVGRFLSLTQRIGRSEMEQALERVGAPRLIERPVHSLSGGQLQRVLLARALLRKPDLLVLDEPTQQVDFSGQLELFERIADLRRLTGCGILMISHDLHVVMAATDRVVCLNQHICCSGEPETVSRHPEYLQLFGPRAARVMALYSHEHDHHHDLTGEVVEDGHAHHHGPQHHAAHKQDGEA